MLTFNWLCSSPTTEIRTTSSRWPMKLPWRACISRAERRRFGRLLQKQRSSCCKFTSIFDILLWNRSYCVQCDGKQDLFTNRTQGAVAARLQKTCPHVQGRYEWEGVRSTPLRTVRRVSRSWKGITIPLSMFISGNVLFVCRSATSWKTPSPFHGHYQRANNHSSRFLTFPTAMTSSLRTW